MASKRVGKIYKIIINDDFYIGSTFNFDHRLKKHKLRSKTSDIKLYKAIRDNNNEFEMTLLYEYECYTDTELRMEERRCYDKLKPNLNILRPYITEEERKELGSPSWKNNRQKGIEYRIKTKEKRKEYCIKNKEILAENNKVWRSKNKEILAENNKVWRSKNKELLSEKAKQYNIKNKDKISEYRKEHYIKNSDKIIEYQKQYRIENKLALQLKRDNNRYICGCGSSVTNTNSAIKNHEQTKKHQKYLFEM
tara:strand:- start:194 stop:946 length:753 start_codon:yes stop_codon:yes gene_type:complete